MPLGISKIGGIVAAVAFTLYFAVGRQSSTTLLFNVVFGALATGILFLPFLPDNYSWRPSTGSPTERPTSCCCSPKAAMRSS